MGLADALSLATSMHQIVFQPDYSAFQTLNSLRYYHYSGTPLKKELEMPVSKTSEEQSCKIKPSTIQPSVQCVYQNVTRVHTIGKEADCVKANQFEGHFNTVSKAVNIGRDLSYSKGICSHKWVCPSKHGDQPKLDCQLQKICLSATLHLSKMNCKSIFHCPNINEKYMDTSQQNELCS